MKVALISNLYGRLGRGGAEGLVQKIAQGFLAHGDQVFVISGAPSQEILPDHVRREVEGNVPVYRFYPPNIYFYSQANTHPIPDRLVWTFLDVFNRPAAGYVRDIILKERPDLILLHNLKGISYFIPRFLKDFQDKIILTLHDVQLVNPSGLIIAGQENHWFSKSPPASFYRACCRFQFEPIRKVVSPSHFLMNFYKERHGFFPDAQALVLKNPMAFHETLRPRLPQVRVVDSINLLFVGQMEEHKGINWLVDCLETNNYLIDGIKVYLKIVGTGSQKGQLPVTQGQLLGELDRQALKVEMLKADYLVFPSICYENSPSVIYEALSLGLPVIAADIGGVGELVKDNFNGFLFQPTGYEKKTGGYGPFKEALVKAGLQSLEAYSRMSLNAQKSVEDCTMDHYINKLLDFYRS
ncbi:glycosyltransferase [Candidatus Uhrbacteria bacterium]|nr:glycosyltransferase [Candidatus Uhrbacteria bacterium]